MIGKYWYEFYSYVLGFGSAPTQIQCEEWAADNQRMKEEQKQYSRPVNIANQ